MTVMDNIKDGFISKEKSERYRERESEEEKKEGRRQREAVTKNVLSASLWQPFVVEIGNGKNEREWRGSVGVGGRETLWGRLRTRGVQEKLN